MDGRWLKWTIRSEIEQLWRKNDGIKPKTRRLFQYILVSLHRNWKSPNWKSETQILEIKIFIFFQKRDEDEKLKLQINIRDFRYFRNLRNWGCRNFANNPIGNLEGVRDFGNNPIWFGVYFKTQIKV